MILQMTQQTIQACGCEAQLLLRHSPPPPPTRVWLLLAISSLPLLSKLARERLQGCAQSQFQLGILPWKKQESADAAHSQDSLRLLLCQALQMAEKLTLLHESCKFFFKPNPSSAGNFQSLPDTWKPPFLEILLCLCYEHGTNTFCEPGKKSREWELHTRIATASWTVSYALWNSLFLLPKA